ncbi:MAG: hypothetical protein D6689_10775 [Deltaproteobacteria bacterium]|nr:MAG: hypothetical protein D6689_10775 [Deltaproteobacteria bacterium]
MRISLPLLVAAGLALAGCSFESADEAARVSLYERLGTRERLAIADPSFVGVAAYDRAGRPLPCVQPTVRGGDTVLRASTDGLLVVEDVRVDLSDITIEPGVVLPDEPLVLTDVKLRLGTQMAIEPQWAPDGRSARGVGRVDILMDWALLDDDGDHLPLATQRIRGAELEVRAELADDGTVRADLTSAVDGTIWDFAAVELTDFAMDVRAASQPVVD